MPTPFHDLKITGLQEDCCHRLAGAVVRIYLRLSETPPVGWPYLFTRVWASLPHAEERRVGVVDGTIWIECVPSEMKTSYLPELEHAVAETNKQYWSSVEQRLAAQQRHEKANHQMRAELAELADSLQTHNPRSDIACPDRSPNPPTRLVRLWQFAGRTLLGTKR